MDKFKNTPKSKYTARGGRGAAPSDVIKEGNGREEAVPAPPPPSRSFMNIMQEARGPTATTRPPPREQAQPGPNIEPNLPTLNDPVIGNMTDEEATGHTSVSLCPRTRGNLGNHQRLVCHWSLRDPNNTNQSWRVNVVDYTDSERSIREHRWCSVRRPAELRHMLAERVFEDLRCHFDEQRRRSGTTRPKLPSFSRVIEELSPLVNRCLNSLSGIGRTFEDMHTNKSTAPLSSAQEAQNKRELERQKKALSDKKKRDEEGKERVAAAKAKREEAQRKANEASLKKVASGRRLSHPGSTMDSSSSLLEANEVRRNPVKADAKTKSKAEAKSAGDETTGRKRATAARPIIESSSSSDYSDSVKPPQTSKEEEAATKSTEETPVIATKKTPARSTESASATSTEKAPAKPTEEAPAKLTEEAPAKPKTSAEPAPAKQDPKASGAIKKLSLAEYAARKNVEKAAAKASTATATSDAESEATVETNAEIEEAQEAQEPRGSIKEIEVKETTTTGQNSPEEGEIIEKHEAHIISTETRTHGTPPPPSPEHKSKANADVEAPSSQPPSLDSPGKRKCSAAEDKPSPDSDTRSQPNDALSPKEDVPSPPKKSKTSTPPGSPDPPPSPAGAASVTSSTSSSSSSSKKWKMVWAEEEGEVTITSPDGTRRVKRARSDDEKDGEASKQSAPAEEKSAEEKLADAKTEALFHSGSEEDGNPGYSVLIAGDEASSPSAQAKEDPADTEEEESTTAGMKTLLHNSSEDDGNKADDEASDS